jgi:hypothetical protein
VVDGQLPPAGIDAFLRVFLENLNAVSEDAPVCLRSFGVLLCERNGSEMFSTAATMAA